MEHNGRLPGKLSSKLAYYPPGCEKHRGQIDTNIANKNIGIKWNAEGFLIRLKPISVALDRVQSDTCVISETVQIWKDPEKTFEENDRPKTYINETYINETYIIATYHIIVII